MLKHLEIQKYVPELNPNSPKQLVEFFATQGIECESVDKSHLESVDHPVAKLIIELRQINKVRTTYLKAILDESEDKGMELHILHTQFRQHQTVTGRMSSGEAQR
jgi:DNA polymerase-1